jgi:hypothetical protein
MNTPLKSVVSPYKQPNAFVPFLASHRVKFIVRTHRGEICHAIT